MTAIYRTLVGHFFGRFFDKESFSAQGDPEANLAHLLGLLAVPGAFFVLLFRPLGVRGWDLVMLRYCFVSLSMLAMGFVMVFEWDAVVENLRGLMNLPSLVETFSELVEERDLRAVARDIAGVMRA